jgi:hypothetical protein
VGASMAFPNRTQRERLGKRARRVDRTPAALPRSPILRNVGQQARATPRLWLSIRDPLIPGRAQRAGKFLIGTAGLPVGISEAY